MKRILVLCLLVLAAAGTGSGTRGGRRRARPAGRRARVHVVDARTGEVLASSNAHERVAIASITKLMTVLLTLEHHKLTDVVTVDPRAAASARRRSSSSRGSRSPSTTCSTAR